MLLWESYHEFTILEQIADKGKGRTHFNLETGDEQSPVKDGSSVVGDRLLYYSHSPGKPV